MSHITHQRQLPHHAHTSQRCTLLVSVDMDPDISSQNTRPGFGMTDLGLILMATLWGVNYSVVKHGLGQLEPYTFNGIRIGLAAVILTLIGLTVKGAGNSAGNSARAWATRRDIKNLLWLGFLGNGVYQLLFIVGMSYTRAGIAALIGAAGPAWIALIARALGRERISAIGWAGIFVQLIGVVCVVASASALDASRDALIGAGLIACGSVAWAVFSVLLQPYTVRVHPFHLSAITMLSGAALLTVVAMPGYIRLDWGKVSMEEWGIIAYASIGALVIGYLLFYRGVRVLGPTRTAVYGNMQPAIALLVAWVALSEVPGGWQLIGAVLIMAGLLVSRSAKVQPAVEHIAEKR